MKDVARAHPQVCDPTEVLELVLAYLPVLNEIDPHMRVRCIERHVMDKAKPMTDACGAIVSLIIGDTTGLLSHLHLLEEKGVITCFDTQDIAQIVVLQRLDMRGIGAQTVFGHAELEVRIILAQLSHQAFGGIAFAIILLRAIVLHNRFGHQWNHFALLWMEKRCAQHLVIIGDRPIAVDLVETRRTVNRRGGKIPRAIEGQ